MTTAMPPVTGDANLAVDLGSLDGTASFTSLEVYFQRNALRPLPAAHSLLPLRALGKRD